MSQPVHCMFFLSAADGGGGSGGCSPGNDGRWQAEAAATGTTGDGDSPLL